MKKQRATYKPRIERLYSGLYACDECVIWFDAFDTKKQDLKCPDCGTELTLADEDPDPTLQPVIPVDRTVQKEFAALCKRFGLPSDHVANNLISDYVKLWNKPFSFTT